MSLWSVDAGVASLGGPDSYPNQIGIGSYASFACKYQVVRSGPLLLSLFSMHFSFALLSKSGAVIKFNIKLTVPRLTSFHVLIQRWREGMLLIEIS